MCGSRPRICVVPSASSGTAPRSDSRKAFGNSSVGTRRRMDVSAEHMVEQARERFQLQDYYGAIHLLEEVVAAGRAFADAHHVLGLSRSEEHTSELQSRLHLVCRLLLEKKKRMGIRVLA